MRNALLLLALTATVPSAARALDDDEVSSVEAADAEPLAPLRRRPAQRQAQAAMPAATGEAAPAQTAPAPAAETESDASEETGSEAAEVEPAPVRIGGPELVEARALLTKKKADLALKRVESLLDLAGLAPEERAQALLLRAETALALKKPRRDLARRSIIELLRQEPESTRLDVASDKLAALAADVKSEQVIVVHDRVSESSTARPLKLKARVLDPESHVAALLLVVRTHPSGVWSELPMRRESSGQFLGIVRDLEKLAPTGSTGPFRFDYYVSARDPDGDELDTHGSPGDPWVVSVERSRAPAGVAASERLSDPEPAATRATSASLAPVSGLDGTMLEAPRPWYKHWATYAVGAVVVGGAGFAAWYYWPQEIKPSLGEVTLP
jgi:hypothetical protein